MDPQNGKKKEKADDQFTGAYPRYSGAISSVTGGPPEDINEMPADLMPTPEKDATIYDGSELPKPGSKIRHVR